MKFDIYLKEEIPYRTLFNLNLKMYVKALNIILQRMMIRRVVINLHKYVKYKENIKGKLYKRLKDYLRNIFRKRSEFDSGSE